MQYVVKIHEIRNLEFVYEKKAQGVFYSFLLCHRSSKYKTEIAM